MLNFHFFNFFHVVFQIFDSQTPSPPHPQVGGLSEGAIRYDAKSFLFAAPTA